MITGIEMICNTAVESLFLFEDLDQQAIDLLLPLFHNCSCDTGDVIFNNGLGRTDLPGGNGAQLKESIRKLSAIDAQWLLSGHGEPVIGADAVSANFEQVERMWFPYI